MRILNVFATPAGGGGGRMRVQGTVQNGRVLGQPTARRQRDGNYTFGSGVSSDQVARSRFRNVGRTLGR